MAGALAVLLTGAALLAGAVDLRPAAGAGEPASRAGNGPAADQEPIHALILTGHNHPAHDWRATTAALRDVLGRDARFRIDVLEDPEKLSARDLARCQVLIQNYQNWERPSLGEAARQKIARFVRDGGGLVLVHFANGAWRDWPDYRRLARRVWLDGLSGHDPYGTFRVEIRKADHPITAGLQPYETTDELYFRQHGIHPVVPLLSARSKVTGEEEPLAFVYQEGRGRVFQSLLGHSAESIRNAGTAELFRRGAAWAAGRAPVLRAAPPAVRDAVDWPVVGNDPGGMRYSPLKQIRRENVRDLQVAWTYHTGDANLSGNTTIECTPIVIDGVMYVTTVQARVAALDAATGRELWKFDSFAIQPQHRIRASGNVNRGVAYWTDGSEKRILLGTSDGRLVSLDARTGRLDPAFGKGGVVDLRAGIEQDISRFPYGCTSAPAVFEDTVILGFSASEDQPGAPGDVRAFNVRTGREVWRFHTVPKPYEFGNDTWEGESWKYRSGANPWGGFTVDTRNGIVFCGTGSAASDFYGADRKGANLFANCTLALDARTGRRLWHFQTTHHDIWDHDTPCPPVVGTITRDGRKVDVVAQVTKTGYCYVFERKSGKPVFGIREVPAPASDVPGEQAYPTQPIPLRPPAFSRQSFTEEDVTNLTPEARAAVLKDFRTRRSGGPYVPPSVRGSIITPGFHGGATWSGASFDPTTGLLYVNSNNVPYLSVLKPGPNGGYLFGGYTYYNDPNGYPAIRPPWGNLTAIDLNRGEIAWQIVLGEYPELRAKGFPPTGTENFGGTIVTAGGLVFIGGTKDEKFHAFDKATGKLLWEYQLPAGGYATPCTYAVNGRQYVVIAAGGGGKLRTKPGDQFIAFALPDRP